MVANRADDISLSLLKAKREGFLPDVPANEVDALEKLATAVYDGDVRQRPDGLIGGESCMARREIISSANALTNQSLRLTHFTATKSETCTQISTVTAGTAAGATPTLCKMAVYRVEDNGDITLLASTANDTTLFAATTTRYTRSLDVPVQKIRGQRYALGLLVVSAAAFPTFYGHTIGPSVITSVEPKISSLVNGQADLPASVVNASIGGGPSFYMEILP